MQVTQLQNNSVKITLSGMDLAGLKTSSEQLRRKNELTLLLPRLIKKLPKPYNKLSGRMLAEVFSDKADGCIIYLSPLAPPVTAVTGSGENIKRMLTALDTAAHRYTDCQIYRADGDYRVILHNSGRIAAIASEFGNARKVQQELTDAKPVFSGMLYKAKRLKLP